MIPRECKRLAEVDFPIAVVSKHSAREKSIRHGHPSTLHLWWARRPLASCRAILLGLLLPDPCDPHCPEEFKTKARKLLSQVGGTSTTDYDLQRALLKFIGDFANWDNSSHPVYLRVSRGLVKAVYGEEPPLVVDPFAGGGSIPLEALRLGCEAFASDLNPVACLILKVMLEDIPRHGLKLAEELRRVGAEIKKEAEKELKEFYPPDSDGSRPIAYLWARTVRCESPNCGAEIPLVRSFWLCKKPNRKRALRYKKVETEGALPNAEFEIFEPKNEDEVPNGSVSRAKATCLCCNTVLPPERVRAQLREQRGGADVIFKESMTGFQPVRIGGARLLAVVTLRNDSSGRHYRLPTGRDYLGVWKAQQRLKKILDAWEHSGRKGLCPVPDEPLPPQGTLGFRVQLYGMTRWGDLFTARQKVALTTAMNYKGKKEPTELLGVLVSRCSSFWSSLNMWVGTGEFVANIFGRQALPIVWDFCEVLPTTSESGGFDGAVDWIGRVIERLPESFAVGQAQPANACKVPLPNDSCTIWFTDPPYYDAVPYADLSDFFFVWLRRTLQNHPLLCNPFNPSNTLTPKTHEIVQDEIKQFNGRPKDRQFFEDRMACAFAEGRRVLRDDGVGCVVFAHKSTEGWEALLTGMIRGGWTITGSWPVATERPGRLRSQESAALATSVHLVCRPRPEDAPVGDWSEILRELPGRIGDWMERLSSEGIRGADLVFACIGPALELFSKYSRVETAEGRTVELSEFLEKVWEVVGRTALGQILGTAEARARLPVRQTGNSAVGALEEDARLTALFLWTLQSTEAKIATNDNSEDGDGSEDEGDEIDEEEEPSGKKRGKGYTLIFDIVRRFAQPLGIHLPVWEGRIIETEKGVVRLLSVKERARQLFGEDGASAVADQIEHSTPDSLQMTLFPKKGVDDVPRILGKGRLRGKKARTASEKDLQTRQSATTLDRVHAAMLLQASGRANALRTLLKAEQQRGPDFLRLANALSALYPKNSEEKRLLDAMLLAMPR